MTTTASITWEILTPSQHRVVNQTATPISNNRVVFLFGRQFGAEKSSGGYLWNAASRAMEPITWNGESPEGRSAHTATLLDGDEIVVIGGQSTTEAPVNSPVWLLDTKTCSWRSISCSGTQPSPRIGASATLISDNCLYLCFGGKKKKIFDDCFSLEIGSRTWKWKKLTFNNKAPLKRAYHASCKSPCGRYLFICGGRRASAALADVWVLDIEANIWSELDSMPDGGRYGHGVVTADKWMIVVGGSLQMAGESEETRVSSVLVFDMVARVWLDIDVLGEVPAGRSGHATALVTCDEGNIELIMAGGSVGTVAAGDSRFLNEVWLCHLYVDDQAKKRRIESVGSQDVTALSMEVSDVLVTETPMKQFRDPILMAPPRRSTRRIPQPEAIAAPSTLIPKQNEEKVTADEKEENDLRVELEKAKEALDTVRDDGDVRISEAFEALQSARQIEVKQNDTIMEMRGVIDRQTELLTKMFDGKLIEIHGLITERDEIKRKLDGHYAVDAKLESIEMDMNKHKSDIATRDAEIDILKKQLSDLAREHAQYKEKVKHAIAMINVQ